MSQMPAAAAAASTDRLQRILNFMTFSEKLKTVYRSVYTSDGRKESTAEHAWHVALFLLLLEKDTDVIGTTPLNFEKALKLALTANLVKIGAGDTVLYSTLKPTKDASGGVEFDPVKRAEKSAREDAAAKDIFPRLPDDLQGEFQALWEECKARQTNEARLVYALGRLHALVQNACCEGRDYKECVPTSTFESEMSLLEGFEGVHPIIGQLGRMLLKEANEKGWIEKSVHPESAEIQEEEVSKKDS